MTKRPSTKKRTTDDGLWTDPQGRVHYISSSGYDMICNAVADELNSVGSALERPAAPTYQVEDARGGKVTYAHTGLSIKDPLTSEEDKQAWIIYQAELRTYEAELARVRGIFICEQGVTVLALPDIEDIRKWAKRRHDRYAMEMPEDDEDLIVTFIGSQVIKSADDGRWVSLGIYRASGADQEVINRIEASFRSDMGQSGPGTDQGFAGQEAAQAVTASEGVA